MSIHMKNKKEVPGKPGIFLFHFRIHCVLPCWVAIERTAKEGQLQNYLSYIPHICYTYNIYEKQ